MKRELDRSMPFDPSDPNDAMSEMFRRQVMQLFIDANGVTLFREMEPEDQIKAFISGSIVGVLCIALGAARDTAAMMKSIEDALPACGEFAQSIIDGEPGR